MLAVGAMEGALCEQKVTNVMSKLPTRVRKKRWKNKKFMFLSLRFYVRLFDSTQLSRGLH